jgi:pyroglutamyl-peptidase
MGADLVWIFQDIPIRVSDDAGHFLCDFVYYSSLAWLYRHEREGRVLFLHVPKQHDLETTEMGVKVAVELIKAVVETHGEMFAGK